MEVPMRFPVAGLVEADSDFDNEDLRNLIGGDPEDNCGLSTTGVDSIKNCGLFAPEDPSLDESAVKSAVTGSDMGGLFGRGSNKAG